MDSTSKQDCKYWDKCYQKNEAHLQKYNHPKRKPSTETPQSSAESTTTTTTTATATTTTTAQESTNDGVAQKRKSSDVADENVSKKPNTQRLWQNPNEDYSELLKTNKFIHAKFLVKMPRDFYTFWDFYTSYLVTEDDSTPFEVVNLQLVGPFEYLAGRFAEIEPKSPGEYLRHWRFYYDPPEFQTIFVKKGTGIHYGYWRDDPKDEENLLIARNDASQGCEFQFVGTNTFDALAYFLEKDFVNSPFTHTKLSRIRKAINEFVTDNKVERHALSIAKTQRWKAIAAKTFHGAGVVVPVDKKSTIGYRPLIESEANLKAILKILDTAEDREEAAKVVKEKLQPIIAASVIALDECDFGTNLELGIDLFCSGHEELHPIVQQLLVSAYTLLERQQFLAILKAHLDDRRKSFNLSLFD